MIFSGIFQGAAVGVPRLGRFPSISKAAAALLLCGPACAGPLAHIEGKVGDIAFSYTAPASMQEMVAQLKNGHTPAIPNFGGTAAFDRVGFRQQVVNADGSAAELLLLLPSEIAAGFSPGVYALGGTTLAAVENGSNDGWDGKCPDDQEAKPVLQVSHYARPDGNNGAMAAMLPSGNLTRQLQTHATRIHRDVATLRILSVDRVAGFVTGEAHGEVSMITPKDSMDINNQKPYEWMCMRGDYRVETETFEIRFTLELDKRLKNSP